MSEEARAARLTLVQDEVAAARTRWNESRVVGPRDARAFPLVGVPAQRNVRRLQFLFEGRGWTWANVSSDLAAAAIAVSVATTSGPHPAALLLFPLVVLAMLHLRGIYGRRVSLPFLDAAGPLLGAISVAAMSVLAWQVVVVGDASASTVILRAWAVTVVLLCAGRLTLGLLRSRARARGLVGKPTLIVGAGNVGSHVARRLAGAPGVRAAPGRLPRRRSAQRRHRQPSHRAGGRRTARPRDGRGHHRRRARHPRFLGHRRPRSRASSRASARSSGSRSRSCRGCSSRSTTVWPSSASAACRSSGSAAVDPKGWQFRLKYAIDRPFAALRAADHGARAAGALRPRSS